MSVSFVDLVNTSIAASWLVLAVILLRLVLKKAPKSIHCALWALVAIRLLCPFSIESPFSLVPSTQTVSDYYLTQEGALDNSPAVLDVVENPVYPDEVDVTLDTESSRVSWMDVEWSAIIWPAGVAAMAIYAFISYLRVRRRVAASIKVGDKLYLCDYVDSPFILGVIKPKIYLPSQMEQQTLDHVVAHEMAHLKRHDHWWKPLGFLLLTLHWFNPVMWVAYILLCQDIELACDEKVIRDMDADSKKAYSAALLSCSVRRPIVAACPLAFGEVSVKERVKNVLHYRKPAFWIVVLAVVLCAAVAVCFLTDPLSPDPRDIRNRKGYTVLAQCTQPLDLTIPMIALPEAVYTTDGADLTNADLVVYRTDTSTIYLTRAFLDSDGSQMHFEFNIEYKLPKVGTFLDPTLFSTKDEVGSGWTVGPLQEFGFSVYTELTETDTLVIPVQMSQITYAKSGFEPDLDNALTNYDPSYENWVFRDVEHTWKYDVGVNDRNQLAFYTPFEEFVTMTTEYADAIAYLQTAYDLDPLTPLDYLDYKTLGWQTETGDDALNTACTAVSQILDIYENSFSKTEGSSDITPVTKPDRIAHGVYQSDEVMFWNPASNTYVGSFSASMLVVDNTITVGSSEPKEVELGWQEECPLTEVQLNIFLDFYDVIFKDKVFILGDDCVYQPIDGTHFLARRDGNIYLVKWCHSYKAPEMIWYIVRMVPQKTTADPFAVQDDARYLPDEAIVDALMARNDVYDSNQYFTCISYEILRHDVMDFYDDSTEEKIIDDQIYVAAKYMAFDRSDETIHANNLFLTALNFSYASDGTYTLTGFWQSTSPAQVPHAYFNTFVIDELILTLDSYDEKLTKECQDQADAFFA